MIKYAILGHLNYTPMFGYELMQSMESSTKNFWHCKLSQIYMTLKLLESEKKLKSEIEGQENKPDRKRYSITKLGKADLQNWLENPITEIVLNKDELLLKLFFSANMKKENLLQELELHLKLHSEKLNHYVQVSKKQIKDSAKDYPHFKKDAILWEATRRMGELNEKASIEWLKETISVIKKKF
jgi:PadR family transcriptional regulator, regulatory protein AphA